MAATTETINGHDLTVELEKVSASTYDAMVSCYGPLFNAYTTFSNIPIDEIASVNQTYQGYKSIVNSLGQASLSDNLYVGGNQVKYVTLGGNHNIVLAANGKILRPNINVTGTPTVDVLVVGGGGGGGMGGGGGGDVVEQTGVTISDTTAVIVGQGGIHGNAYTDTLTKGGTGGTSSFGSITASGGGGGGVYQNEEHIYTYDEIVSSANTEGYPWTNTIAILNLHPVDYFNDLNSGNHLSFLEGGVLVDEDTYYINGIMYETSGGGGAGGAAIKAQEPGQSLTYLIARRPNTSDNWILYNAGTLIHS